MNTIRRYIGVLVVGVLCAGLIACTSDQVTLSLEAAVDSASIALPVIAGATGIPADQTAALTRYLADVNIAAKAATSILDESTLTPAQKGAAIAAAFASVVVPDMPAGTPATVVAVTQAVANGVSNFLAQVQTTSAAITFSRPDMVTAFGSGSKVARPDKKKLAEIRRKVAANLAALGSRGT